MANIEVNLSSEYGIMFLYDSKVQPIFPNEAGEKAVAWTSTCLAFSVLIYVDGDAKIILGENLGEQSYPEYFSGEIACPSKSISLFDSNGIAFACLPLTDEFARVSLRMSEETNPDIVKCAIGNMKTF